MTKTLNEAFVLSKTKTNNGKNIVYLNPNKPENKDSFTHKDIFKRASANWSQSPKFKNMFPPHSPGFWFWWVGETKDQWYKVYNMFIKPALEKAHKAQGASPEESEASLLASVDELIKEISSTDPPKEMGGNGVKAIENIKEKLIDFKEKLINLENDEEYKKTMRAIIAFKNAQGHPYSFMNSILIWLQNRNARFVMSRIRWEGYNRTVNKDAKTILVKSPANRAMKPYSKDEKENMTNKFINDLGKKDYGELSIGEKDKLGIRLRGSFSGTQFQITEAFDVADTTQIEGKENHVKDIEKKSEVKWYEEDMVDEKVRPIYTALIDYAKSLHLTINLVSLEKLGGARGSSGGGGVITLPENEGNDVGLTKTLSHELSHSLLHQKYVSEKNKEMSQYFLGREGHDAVEQQAELAAWTVLGLFGFDLQTTSINYAMLWGANKDDMIKVYDTVSVVVNLQVREINKRLNMQEGEGGLTPAREITALDIAREVGNESEYLQILKKNQMVERFNHLSTKE